MPTILRSRSIPPASILFFLLPLMSSFRSPAVYLRSSLRDLLGGRNPTNCRQSHICRISALARYWLPLSSCHTIANSPRVYRRDHVCKISILRDINKKERDFSGGAMIYETTEVISRDLRGEGVLLRFSICRPNSLKRNFQSMIFMLPKWMRQNVSFSNRPTKSII